MDEIKINKWKIDFEAEVQRLAIESIAPDTKTPFKDCYTLIEDDLTLRLDFPVDCLSQDIKDRLENIFLQTMPEDSV